MQLWMAPVEISGFVCTIGNMIPVGGLVPGSGRNLHVPGENLHVSRGAPACSGRRSRRPLFPRTRGPTGRQGLPNGGQEFRRVR